MRIFANFVQKPTDIFPIGHSILYIFVVPLILDFYFNMLLLMRTICKKITKNK